MCFAVRTEERENHAEKYDGRGDWYDGKGRRPIRVALRHGWARVGAVSCLEEQLDTLGGEGEACAHLVHADGDHLARARPREALLVGITPLKPQLQHKVADLVLKTVKPVLIDSRVQILLHERCHAPQVLFDLWGQREEMSGQA